MQRRTGLRFHPGLSGARIIFIETRDMQVPVFSLKEHSDLRCRVDGRWLFGTLSEVRSRCKTGTAQLPSGTRYPDFLL